MPTDVKLNAEGVEAALKAFAPDLFGDDPQAAHMAASPLHIEAARTPERIRVERAIFAYLATLDNSKPTPAVGDDGLIEALKRIAATPPGKQSLWHCTVAAWAVDALAAAHSQHEADVAMIGELTDIADELDDWVRAALDCKDWYWDGDQREAAEYSRSRLAKSALAKVKP